MEYEKHFYDTSERRKKQEDSLVNVQKGVQKYLRNFPWLR